MNDVTSLTGTTSVADLFFRPGAGRSEAVLDLRMTYEAEAPRTGGRLVCVEITVPPGRGIAPHRRGEEDEAFHVLAGRVRIDGDDCANGVALDAGGFSCGPRGREHGSRGVGPETARPLVLIAPGSGIERMSAGLAGLTRPQQRGGIDPAQVAATCGRHGVSFVNA